MSPENQSIACAARLSAWFGTRVATLGTTVGIGERKRQIGSARKIEAIKFFDWTW